MTAVSLAVVIPTRNRSDMAITAIRHLREQSGDLTVFVSDNSSDPEQVRALADYCAGLGDARVVYMRSPGNLGQGQHWDWAIRQAFERSAATHATIHYDRKVARPGMTGTLAAAAERFPGKVITYTNDFVSTEPPPRRLWQTPWTGNLYRLQTARAVEVSARGDAARIGHMLPILSNCLVPRAVVERLVERFGDLCVSTTADSCFAYRFFASYDDYLHLDRPLAILYGSDRSAAVGYLSGGGGDFADYRQTFHGDTWLDAAVIPGLNLGYNMLFHEYELVRRAVGGDRLPPLDRDGCLRDLGRWLPWIRDPELRDEIRALLVDHGWDGKMAPAYSEIHAPAWRRAYRRLRQRIILLLADRLGRAPHSVSGFEFGDDEKALRYAMRFPQGPTISEEHLALAEPAEIDAVLP